MFIAETELRGPTQKAFVHLRDFVEAPRGPGRTVELAHGLVTSEFRSVHLVTDPVGVQAHGQRAQGEGPAAVVREAGVAREVLRRCLPCCIFSTVVFLRGAP